MILDPDPAVDHLPFAEFGSAHVAHSQPNRGLPVLGAGHVIDVSV